MNRRDTYLSVCAKQRCPHRRWMYATEAIYCTAMGDRRDTREYLVSARMSKAEAPYPRNNEKNQEPFVIPQGCLFNLEMLVLQDQPKN